MMRVRRLLSRKVSIGAMLEFGLWLGLVHVLIGLVWTFLHYDTVTRLEVQLQTLLPAGAELAGFGLMLLASAVCAT